MKILKVGIRVMLGLFGDMFEKYSVTYRYSFFYIIYPQSNMINRGIFFFGSEGKGTNFCSHMDCKVSRHRAFTYVHAETLKTFLSRKCILKAASEILTSVIISIRYDHTVCSSCTVDQKSLASYNPLL